MRTTSILGTSVLAALAVSASASAAGAGRHRLTQRRPPSAAAFSEPAVVSATGPGTGPFDEAQPDAVSGPAGAGWRTPSRALPR